MIFPAFILRLQKSQRVLGSLYPNAEEVKGAAEQPESNAKVRNGILKKYHEFKKRAAVRRLNRSLPLSWVPECGQ